MSWNTLEIAGELGINRVVVASSVNSIGMSTSSSLLPLLQKLIPLHIQPNPSLPALSERHRPIPQPSNRDPELPPVARSLIISLLKTTSIRLSPLGRGTSILPRRRVLGIKAVSSHSPIPSITSIIMDWSMGGHRGTSTEVHPLDLFLDPPSYRIATFSTSPTIHR
jgi:hypothetical protein